jgi:hypothetical protein
LDVVSSERFRDLFREVEELNKDQDAFVGRDALPEVKVSGQLYLIKTPWHILDQVDDLLQLHPKVLPLPITLVVVHSKCVAFDDVEDPGGGLAFTRTSVDAVFTFGSGFDVVVAASMTARRKDGDFFGRNLLAATLARARYDGWVASLLLKISHDGEIP